MILLNKSLEHYRYRRVNWLARKEDITMTQAQLEEAVVNQFDNGRYTSTGADGGVLRYILVKINGDDISASITLDHEIAKIRRIWEMSKNGVKLYDLTDTYYELRR